MRKKAFILIVLLGVLLLIPAFATIKLILTALTSSNQDGAIQVIETNAWDSDIIYTVTCGTTSQIWTESPLVFSLASGSYNCTLSSSEGENWSANSSIATIQISVGAS